MMAQRAKESKNKNFILSQHYQTQGENVFNTFNNERKNAGHKDNDIIMSVYGHVQFRLHVLYIQYIHINIIHIYIYNIYTI